VAMPDEGQQQVVLERQFGSLGRDEAAKQRPPEAGHHFDVAQGWRSEVRIGQPNDAPDRCRLLGPEGDTWPHPRCCPTGAAPDGGGRDPPAAQTKVARRAVSI
jgi:hypothetical protein